MVTVLGPFDLGEPALAGDCHGVLAGGCVARRGGFNGVLGFGFIARATWFICWLKRSGDTREGLTCVMCV